MGNYLIYERSRQIYVWRHRILCALQWHGVPTIAKFRRHLCILSMLLWTLNQFLKVSKHKHVCQRENMLIWPQCETFVNRFLAIIGLLSGNCRKSNPAYLQFFRLFSLSVLPKLVRFSVTEIEGRGNFVKLIPNKTSQIKGEGIYWNFGKTCVKLFLNFTSIPFDYILISWVTICTYNRGVLNCLLYREVSGPNLPW